MTSDELFDLLEQAVEDSARLLADKVKKGEASAADITQIRALFRDAGGTLAFRGKPTSTGDSVLDSLRDVDPDMLN